MYLHTECKFTDKIYQHLLFHVLFSSSISVPCARTPFFPPPFGRITLEIQSPGADWITALNVPNVDARALSLAC